MTRQDGKKVEPEMEPEKLKEMIIEKIDDYLAGKISEKDATEWALKIIKKYPLPNNERGIHSALGDLLGLDEPERFRTAREDLIEDKKQLMGKMQ